MVLTVQTTKNPAVTITRTATKASELVYIAVANKAIKYPKGKSRIVYIGTTKMVQQELPPALRRKQRKCWVCTESNI